MLKNRFDKIEQYSTFRCDDPTEFKGLLTIGILTKMLQTGLYVSVTSSATVGGRFLSEETMDSCWKARMEPTHVTELDVRNMFYLTQP